MLIQNSEQYHFYPHCFEQLQLKFIILTLNFTIFSSATYVACFNGATKSSLNDEFPRKWIEVMNGLCCLTCSPNSRHHLKSLVYNDHFRF